VGNRSGLWWVPLVVTGALATGCAPAPTVATPDPPSASSAAPAPTASPTASREPQASPSPSPEPTEASEAVTRVEVTLADGKAEPNGEKVELARGDTVEFVVTSDRDDLLHVHGVDVEIPVGAGETVTKRIELAQTGRFEVESHHPELLIVQLVVR